MSPADLDVLIVDDHEPMRALLTRSLEVAGVARVRTAAGGAEALELLAAEPASLILADYNMPEMDGPAFVAAVRAAPEMGSPRIIVISGHTEKTHAEAARAAGADLVLAKPVGPRELMTAIATLFES